MQHRGIQRGTLWRVAAIEATDDGVPVWVAEEGDRVTSRVGAFAASTDRGGGGRGHDTVLGGADHVV